MFRIGEFAQLAGVSAKALRNYDVRGIFQPAWVDPGNRYRYYSPAQLPELRRVLALRDLGIPLAEVSHLLQGGGDLKGALERRRRHLEAAQAKIAADLATLDIRVEMAGRGPDVVVRTVARQLVAILDQPRAGETVADLFYRLEAVVRDVGARASLPPGMRLTPNEESGFEIFVPVTRPVAAEGVVTRSLPARRVAALIHRGPYHGVVTARQTLEDWIEAAGYRQIDHTRILYLQFGAESELGIPAAYLTDQPGEFVTEIQIPIER
ncbi:MAG TPA: MerR family transcriptional regulator [Acidimicrobiia bacterium]|nr:MerR family transcriptional regulator [Acidimicrobiia bacterium]